jgi:tetratricopeptide (TPR) repeat protein
MAFSAIRRSEWGDDQFVLWAVVWGLGAFFIDNLFSFTILKPNVSLHVWVMLAIFVALCREVKDGREAVSKGHWQFVALPLMALVVLYFLFRMAMGFWSYQAGREAYQLGDLGSVERNLNHAQEWDPWRARFRAALGDIYLKAYFETGEVKYFDRAEAQYWQAIHRSPLTYTYYFILSKLYERHGDKTKAEQLTREAIALSPYEYKRDVRLLAEMAERKKFNKGGVP